MKRSPITAIVTAYMRIKQTKDTILRLQKCDPQPTEIIVHVDGDQLECEAALRETFPEVLLLRSDTCVGPGGARNTLITAASYEFVASFDDDSYPIDSDYFARLMELFARYPDASIITGRVFHRREPIEPATETARWSADFSGGACAYRRESFLRTAGYVPLPTAYGMEEVDLAIRLHARGRKVLFSDWLRVFHDTDVSHHTTAMVTSGSIVNVALLSYLRYPVAAWPLGVLQIGNRVWWLVRHGRFRGVISGICRTPAYLWKHRRMRAPVSLSDLRSYWYLRRNPVSLVIE